MATPLQPLPATSRDSSLDILRGFALAGVLFMFCVSDIGSPAGYVNSLLDDIIDWFKYILVESRMYTMLILIFGIGFHVQLKKAKQHKTSLVPVFLRRLTGLLIIGFIHAILLSDRDILIFYALAGFALLPVRNATNRQLFFYTLFLFILLVTPVLDLFLRNPWSQTRALEQPNNYPDNIRYNWEWFKIYHLVYPIYIDMLFHFLLGFWIGRFGILQKLKGNKKLRRRLLIISLVCSVVLIPSFYFWIPDFLPGLMAKIKFPWLQFIVATLYRIIWQLWMMVSVTLYATLLIGLSINSKVRSLAAFGQMALSNYLIQSLILVPYLLLFDKYQNMPAFNGLVLFLIVFVLQLVFSTWWLTRYTMGPFEWLLRSITYWKWQPIKKSSLVSKNLNSFSIQN